MKNILYIGYCLDRKIHFDNRLETQEKRIERNNKYISQGKKMFSFIPVGVAQNRICTGRNHRDGDRGMYLRVCCTESKKARFTMLTPINSQINH